MRVLLVFLMLVGVAYGEQITHPYENFVNGTAATADEVDANFDASEVGIDDNADDIDALQALDTIPEMETAETVNVILETEMDASSEMIALMDDETGTGSMVFGTSPSLTTPALGTPSALVLTNATSLPIGALPAANTIDSELSTLTITTTAPVDGTDACTEGDSWLDHTANKFYLCVDTATDDWFGVALTDTP